MVPAGNKTKWLSQVDHTIKTILQIIIIRKLFWAAVALAVNAADTLGTVSPLEMFRNKALVGFMKKTAETIPI